MATKYRNTDNSKPQIIQTQSSTSPDPILNKAKQFRGDKDNVKNVSVGILSSMLKKRKITQLSQRKNLNYKVLENKKVDL